MAANYSVFTRILGEDLASEVFRKVGASAKSAFAPIKAFNQAVNEPKTTALGNVGSKVDQVAGKFRSGLGSITAWLPALGAIGSAATLGGLIAMTRTNAEAFEGLTLSAEKLGVATKDLAVWRFGAKMTGVENEALEKGLVKLKKAMYDAATGKNKDVALLFQRMKIPLRDAAGAVKNVDASLEDIAEAFKNTTDEEVKSRAALALFGKSGADMIPFLNRGRAGIAAWREELKKYSNLTDENRRDLGELAEGYKRLDKAGSGLSMKLSAVFAPALSKVVNWTTNWITANRDLIAQSLERRLDGIGRAFRLLARAADDIAKTPFIAELFKGADASTVLDGALIVLGATMTGPLLAAFQTVTAAILRMNLAVLRNPFYLLAAWVVGAAAVIVSRWDEVKQAFVDAWDWGGVLGVALQALNVTVNAMYIALNELTKALFGIDLDKWGQWFEDIFTGVFDRVMAKVREWIAKVKELMSPFTSWYERNSVPIPTPAYAVDTADRYRQAYSAPPLLANPQSASAAPTAPQQVNVVFSGEIKAPPGSTIDTRVEGGNARGRPDVGYSMRPETNY